MCVVLSGANKEQSATHMECISTPKKASGIESAAKIGDQSNQPLAITGYNDESSHCRMVALEASSTIIVVYSS
jgi:hypothetical protein